LAGSCPVRNRDDSGGCAVNGIPPPTQNAGSLFLMTPGPWLSQNGANGYSGFDSALFRNLDAKWHFPQENATLLDLQMSTSESKPL